jgi:catechol 2,3-dioxygenase-like lactoylglutathione lyase family enzyme
MARPRRKDHVVTPDTRIGAVTLLVADYDEAVAWFTQKLGFELVTDTPQPAGKRWVTVAPGRRGEGGGPALLLARAATDDQRARIGDQAGGRVFLFLETSDFVAAHAQMTAAGVEFLESPRHEPYGRVAVFRDLCGNKWDLIGRQPRSGE